MKDDDDDDEELRPFSIATRMGNMRKVCSLIAIVGALNVVFVACGGGSDDGGVGTGPSGPADGSASAPDTSTADAVDDRDSGIDGGDAGRDAANDAADAGADAESGDGSVHGDACTTYVVEGKRRPVDIVWAVDTSGSMDAEISQIKANINGQFADILAASGLDYQVIMVATKGVGTFQVCAAPPLGGPNCGDNPPFYRVIPQTVGSTNALSLLLSTYDNANLALRWDQYLRMDALKAFIVVTDDNSSLPAASFDTQLLAKQPAGMFGTAEDRKYVFHGIVGVSANDPSVKCGSAVNTGAQYQTLGNLTGGKLLPVCAADYSPLFQEIAKGIVDSIACELPVPSVASGGAFDPNDVSLRFVPESGAPVSVARVQDATQCAGDGWHYDDNASPKKLVLCSQTCQTVQASQSAKMDIIVGCPGQ